MNSSVRSAGIQVAGVVCALLSTGCASITTAPTQTIRVEAFTAENTAVSDARCRLENDRGIVEIVAPGSATVERSAADMTVRCAVDGHGTADAVLTSRANAGMVGNVLFGGVIGAMMDHNRGAAYTYPAWIRLQIGRLLAFDRNDDRDGEPSIGRPVATSTASTEVAR